MQINTFYDNLNTVLRDKLEKAMFKYGWNISEKDIDAWADRRIFEIAKRLAADVEIPVDEGEVYE